jgi:hypothetical protein
MNKEVAEAIGRRAMDHLEDTAPFTLKWARQVSEATFRAINLRAFLGHYCFVVYASGFRFAVVEARFPALRAAFCNFEKAGLERMHSIEPVLQVINNQRKAQNFLDGAHAVIEEGISPYKKRLAASGPSVLQELPGIGPITQDHLAKNIGLRDVPKADVWLERVAALCDSSITELMDCLSETLGESQHVIDVALWTLAKDGLLTGFGYEPAKRGRTITD